MGFFVKNRASIINVVILACLCLVSVGCSDDKTPPAALAVEPWGELDITASVSKWRDGHTAAVSITYDGLWHSDPLILVAADDALSRGLPLSFELVTSSFVDYPDLIIRMREELLPRGITFYGHGHEHYDFDTLSYDDCYASFSLCYNYMRAWGLNPKSYAYPHGKGFKSTTKFANRMAGFVCARGLTFMSNPNYICQYDEKEPRDWYYLPTISVARDLEGYVNTHEDMSAVIETCIERAAWIIIMYHSIGFPDGWGYYPYDDYIRDIDRLAYNDFWCAPMGTIACYVQERNAFKFGSTLTASGDDWKEYRVRFWDGLDNSIYDEPLTVDLIFHSEDAVDRAVLTSSDSIVDVHAVEHGVLRLQIIPDDGYHTLTVYRAEASE